MIIYGTAILAICHLLGDYLGNTLGMVLGVKANVGGVAISMILLILSKELLAKRLLTSSHTIWRLVLVRYVYSDRSCDVGRSKCRCSFIGWHVRADCLYCIVNWHGFSHPLFK